MTKILIFMIFFAALFDASRTQHNSLEDLLNGGFDLAKKPSINLREQFKALEIFKDVKNDKGCIPFISDVIRVMWSDCQTKADSLAWSTWGQEITQALKGKKIDLVGAGRESCKLQADKENCANLGHQMQSCDFIGVIKTMADIQTAKTRCDNLSNLSESVVESLDPERAKAALGIGRPVNDQPDLLEILGTGIPWAAKALQANSGASSPNLLSGLVPAAAHAAPQAAAPPAAGVFSGGNPGGIFGSLTGGNSGGGLFGNNGLFGGLGGGNSGGGNGLLNAFKLPKFPGVPSLGGGTPGNPLGGGANLLELFGAGTQALNQGGAGGRGFLGNFQNLFGGEVAGNFMRNLLSALRR